jgi:hypothetical protein
MAKKKASNTTAALPINVAYSPSIGNTELVNLLVEQHITALEHEVAELQPQREAANKAFDDAYQTWIDSEIQRITESYGEAIVGIFSGAAKLAGVEAPAKYYIHSGLERCDRELHLRQLAKGAKVHHRLHVGFGDKQDGDNWLKLGPIFHAISRYLVFEREAVYAEDQFKLVEKLDAAEALGKRIAALEEDIANRERVEKQALARLTANVVQANPELALVIKGLAGDINNGQLLLN